MKLCEIRDESSYNTCSDISKSISSFLTSYKWLIDAFVLDFFTENHWQLLPVSWQNTFDKMELITLSEFITLDRQKSFQMQEVLPLSLLAFRATAQVLSLEREPPKSGTPLADFIQRVRSGDTNGDINASVDPSILLDKNETISATDGQQLSCLSNNFRRCVKPKKQHEIIRLSEVIHSLIKDKSSCRIVDIGSGQGHLSRLLSFGNGYDVVTVEAEDSHIRGAKNLDDKIMTNLRKRAGFKSDSLTDADKISLRPHHVVRQIDNCVSAEELENIIGVTSNTGPLKGYWLVGLHTCGSLATNMMKLLTESRNAIGMVSVACCYMKMDTKSQQANDMFSGFPMSMVIQNIENHDLSYEAREVACHAIELYQKKLKDNCRSFKIHCYRATLEVLIVRHYPLLKRLGLRSVKRAECMSFAEYACVALQKKDLIIPIEDFTSPAVRDCMSQWKRVIVFYSLRLLLAPVIETLILIDRLLYLFEKGVPGLVVPLFDPLLSPRNHVLIAFRGRKSSALITD